MFMAKRVDIDALKQLVNNNAKAKAILEIFAQRQRGRANTTYSRLKRVLENKSISLTLVEFKDIFEMFELAECGHLDAKTGRVFNWTWNLSSVANAVLSNSTSKIDRQKRKNPALLKLTAPKADKLVQDIVTIKKGSFEIAVNLADITPEKCQKISQFISNLSS